MTHSDSRYIANSVPMQQSKVCMHSCAHM